MIERPVGRQSPPNGIFRISRADLVVRGVDQAFHRSDQGWVPDVDPGASGRTRCGPASSRLMAGEASELLCAGPKSLADRANRLSASTWARGVRLAHDLS
jgi:hypothetical protein